MQVISMRSNCSSQKGFTLIELLVVIAIIAILAAILFPVFISAKEHGRQVTCLSNLHQLGMAIRSYTDDWQGRLPTARVIYETPGGTCRNWSGSYGTGTASGSDTVVEKGQIFPYVKSAKVYLCPSDKGRKAKDARNPFPLSYSMNFMLSWRVLENMQKPPDAYDYNAVSNGANNRLSKILMLIHEDRDTINDGDFHWATKLDVPDHVHYDGTTLLFCDIHAKWQNAKTITKAIDKGEYNPDAMPL
jgi:prepilin-type N-terminal cleavage/methylation domain-containing protein